MSKPIGVRIDERQEKIWRDFKEFVEEKYGKKHTVLGQELIEAIRFYIKADEEAGKGKEGTHKITKKEGRIEIDFIKENSHEIINPLFIAKGYIEVLKNAGIFNEEQIEEMEMIDKNLSKIDKIIQNRIKKIQK